MLKKLSILSLALLLLLSLAACGKDAAAKPEEVTDLELTLTFPVWEDNEVITIERTGKYTGTMVNDLPNGTGRFDTQNTDGDPWYYKGDFKDGLFHGQDGEASRAGTTNLERGTFTDGLYTPNRSQLLDYIGQIDPKFNLSGASYKLIDENEDMFPCVTEASSTKAVNLTNFDLQYKQIVKSPDQYTATMHRAANLSAMQVFEDGLYGNRVTTILASDPDYNYYYIYMVGSIEIYEGDTFELYGLPVAASGFPNVGGGTTNTVVVFASIINVA